MAEKRTDWLTVNPKRLTDSEMVGIALDLLNEHHLLNDKNGLKFMLEVIAERRERPKEIRL